MALIDDLKMAAARLSDAKRAYSTALMATCKDGAGVRWLHNEHPQEGVILHNDAWGRVYVRNSNTGRAMWLYADRLTHIGAV